MYFSFFGRGKLKRAIIIALLLQFAAFALSAQSSENSAGYGPDGNSANNGSVSTGNEPSEQSATQASGSVSAESLENQQSQAANLDSAENPGVGPVDESTLTFDFDDESSEDADAVGTVEAVPLFGIWDLLRMVLVLALVVGLIYALYYFLKRSRDGSTEQSSFISLLSSQSLPGGKQLHIIDVAGRVYLLGAADGSINLITEIDDKASIDELRLQASRKQLQGANFSQLLSGFFSKSQSADNPVSREADADGDQISFSENSNSLEHVEDAQQSPMNFDFIRRQRERLKKL